MTMEQCLPARYGMLLRRSWEANSYCGHPGRRKKKDRQTKMLSEKIKVFDSKHVENSNSNILKEITCTKKILNDLLESEVQRRAIKLIHS